MRCYFLFLAIFLFFSCTGKKEESKIPVQNQIISGDISIGGAYAFSRLMQSWADSFVQIYPDVEITIEINGSSEGLTGLKSGTYDIAMLSNPNDEHDTSGLVTYIPVVQDAVIPIMNSKNPYLKEIEERGINPQQFQKLYILGEKITWGEILNNNSGKEVIVYTRSDGSGAAVVWAGFLWKNQADLKGLPVNGEYEMLSKIQSDVMGIGYSNLANAYDLVTKKPLENIDIIPIDLDFDGHVNFKEIKKSGLDELHRSIWLGKYPKTLCRKLNIAVKSEDLNPQCKEFIHYVLKRGQEQVSGYGYCELNNIQLRRSVNILDEVLMQNPEDKNK